MFDAWERGDVVAARAVNARMLESFAFETGDLAPNPIPTKAMLRTLGWTSASADSHSATCPTGSNPGPERSGQNLEASRG